MYSVASDKILLLPSCVFHIQISFPRLFAKFVAVMVYSMPNMSARSRHHRKKKLMHFSYFALIRINDGILICILFSVLLISCSIFESIVGILRFVDEKYVQKFSSVYVSFIPYFRILVFGILVTLVG